MRLFAISLAAVALIALPAHAQNSTDQPKPKAAVTKKKTTVPGPSSNPEYDVYLNGRYIGSDPDPRVRYHMIQEERGRHDDGGRERPR
ncbi:MAG TPA: hypothetical protein VFA53_01665 [Xanthobacteraceae bacterium]|nr:hypothetical protein [Xanthobacteraceae bacterium]